MKLALVLWELTTILLEVEDLVPQEAAIAQEEGVVMAQEEAGKEEIIEEKEGREIEGIKIVEIHRITSFA